MTAPGQSQPVPTDDVEQLYAALLNDTQSTRTRNNLKHVRAALEHIRKLKQPDFSPAAVGRAIQELKLPGPRTQSLYNAEGKVFRLLIQAYATAYGAVRVPTAVSSEEAEEALIAGISDHRVAFEVRNLITEARSLRRRVNLTHKLYSELAPIDVLPFQVTDAAALKALPAKTANVPTLTETELGAIRTFLATIPTMWEVDPETGAVMHPGGYEIAPPGLYDALQKIAATASP